MRTGILQSAFTPGCRDTTVVTLTGLRWLLHSPPVLPAVTRPWRLSFVTLPDSIVYDNLIFKWLGSRYGVTWFFGTVVPSLFTLISNLILKVTSVARPQLHLSLDFSMKMGNEGCQGGTVLFDLDTSSLHIRLGIVATRGIQVKWI